MKKLHTLRLPSWYLPHGGQFVCNQAQILKEFGFDVNVLANVEISLSNDKLKYFTFPFKSKFCNEDGLLVYRHFFRCLPKATQLNAKLWAKNTLKLFEKYQKKFGKPDIIHVHSAIWGGYAAYLIKEKYNIPYIITEHRGRFGQSCDYAKNMFADWQTPLLEKAFSESSFIIPVSENLVPKIRTFLKKDVPIFSIPTVLNTDFFHYKKRNISEKIRFVTTNGFYFVKGYDILIPAFDAACNKNSNIEISIVGENFDGKDLKKIWKNVKNKDNFRFAGFQNTEGVRDELWQADIFVLASRIEAQPSAVLEALSTGLPMVCTTVVPKVVATDENSIVVPVENVDLLTNAIVEMAKNYQKYNGKNISEHIKLVAGKDAFAKQIIEIYEQIINCQNI